MGGFPGPPKENASSLILRVKRRDTGKNLAFQELEGCTPSCRDVRHLVRQPRLDREAWVGVGRHHAFYLLRPNPFLRFKIDNETFLSRLFSIGTYLFHRGNRVTSAYDRDAAFGSGRREGFRHSEGPLIPPT